MHNMQTFWTNIAEKYWEANDLEQKQRVLTSLFLEWKKWKLIELGCGNWKLIGEIIKRNKKIDILWVDYNKEMIKCAQEQFPEIRFVSWDMANIQNVIWDNWFDFVVCINSIHNLPNYETIDNFFQKMKEITNNNWHIIFDIRNCFNPFINYWYSKNRKKWLHFFTLNKNKILKSFWNEFETILDQWIIYSSLEEAGKHRANIFIKIVYYLYLILVKFTFFAPYQFIILRKR